MAPVTDPLAPRPMTAAEVRSLVQRARAAMIRERSSIDEARARYEKLRATGPRR